MWEPSGHSRPEATWTLSPSLTQVLESRMSKKNEGFCRGAKKIGAKKRVELGKTRTRDHLPRKQTYYQLYYELRI